MRHRKTTVKLGRKQPHRDAMLASQVCSLILRGRIKTTVPKAKASRRLAEKMVTLGKKGTLAARRQALSTLHMEQPVRELFDRIAPGFAERKGGYTRIVRLAGLRAGDSSDMAMLEWTNYVAPAPKEKKAAKKADAKPSDSDASAQG
jgi:large subunit ribosomal protein L17